MNVNDVVCSTICISVDIKEDGRQTK